MKCKTRGEFFGTVVMRGLRRQGNIVGYVARINSD